MICPVCGKAFEARHGLQKYCSARCCKAASRERNRAAYNEYHRRYYRAHREYWSLRAKKKRRDAEG